MEPATATYGEVSRQGRREELILGHLGLVRHVLGRLVADLPASVDLENLEAAGVLGLVEAAQSFDPERGVQFQTFAYPRIRGAVLDELRRNCPLPQQVLERLALLRKAAAGPGAPTTVEELAAATGLAEAEVAECLEASRLAQPLPYESAHDPAARGRDDDPDRPDRHAEAAEQRRRLAEAIAALPERERLVVTLYYLEDLRLKEIGQLLGLSESRVSRVLSAAVFRLGEFIRAGETG